MATRIATLLTLCLLAPAALAQQFGPAQFRIKASDGAPISNHSVTAAYMSQLARLPGIVDVGGPRSDVTLYQFYDLNCTFCREAARDVDALVRDDPALQLVFVPYPVLSVRSIEGARVELAIRELATAQKFFEFHRQIYAGRGTIDGDRALAVAAQLGLDVNRIVAIGNTPKTTETMKAHARLGAAMQLVATPAYIIQGVAILGHPGLDSLKSVVASVRTCKKVAC